MIALRHGLSGTTATAGRVLAQLARDPGSIVLVLLVPCMLLALLDWAFSRTPGVFDRIGPQMFGVFPLIVMFAVASIATLRERVDGTLERLLAMPMSRLELLLGYLLGFGALALAQACLTTALAVTALGMDVAGPTWLLLLTAALNALLGVGMGLLTSAFARTEFQAVQHLPALVLPQFLLCGLFVPLDAMPLALRLLAKALPMTYAVRAATRIAAHPGADWDVGIDLLAVTVFLLLATLLGAVTLRRRTP